MYEKVLVPLDESKESEAVIPLAQEELTPDGEIILLHVVPPCEPQIVDGHLMSADQLEAEVRSAAMGYLQEVIDRAASDPRRWRREVFVSPSVAQGIVDVAWFRKVDLVAMYTHDRKGLARLVQRSVARGVERRARPTEVKVFKPKELVIAA